MKNSAFLCRTGTTSEEFWRDFDETILLFISMALAPTSQVCTDERICWMDQQARNENLRVKIYFLWSVNYAEIVVDVVFGGTASSS